MYGSSERQVFQEGCAGSPTADSVHGYVENSVKRAWGMVSATKIILNRLHGPTPEPCETNAKNTIEATTMYYFSDLVRALSELEDNIKRISTSIG